MNNISSSFQDENRIVTVQFANGNIAGASFASFSRHGGVSPSPFHSNNIGSAVGDSDENVDENKERIKRHLALDYLVSARQVHGKKVHVVEGPITEDLVVEECDALITNVAGIGLMIGHADCQAVLLYDPVHRVVGAIHSGWRGSVANIIEATVKKMQERYTCNAQDIQAAIGPSLGPCCAEFVNYKSELPESFWLYQVKENYFDFWQISKAQLTGCGVLEKSIYSAGICTFCNENFFSYRRVCRDNNGITGRNGSVAALISD